MQFKPVIFIILGISLMSLAVTSGLQQTAMAKPKFDSSPLGKTCKAISDAIDGLIKKGNLSAKEAILFIKLMDLYDKYCFDKYGVKGLNPDLKEYLDKLLNDSKIPQKDLDQLKSILNSTKNSPTPPKCPDKGPIPPNCTIDPFVK